MNSEVRKIEINVVDDDDKKAIVFNGVEYKQCLLPNCVKLIVKWSNKNAKVDTVILSSACGAIRPGRLTFILGPSGAGKTTLLKILAGRKKNGVKGKLQNAGRRGVLVDQHANLLDTLTAMETLRFAAWLKLPNASKSQQLSAIEKVSEQLGIHDVLYTKAGRLSGGERKRLTIACELLIDPYVILLDEPTSGLDSVSSMSMIKALQTVALSGRTVACVIHQPSSKLYAAADDIILLANGRTLYAGAAADVPLKLQQADLVCPLFYNMADYLLEIASGEHDGNLALLEAEAQNYAYQMMYTEGCDIISSNREDTEAEELLKHKIPKCKFTYPANFGKQLVALLWRCLVCALRDVYLTQIRLAAHFLVALLLGALYDGAGADASRIFSNTACIFFFLLFLFFSNAMPTIQTFPSEATVIMQEHLNKWYSLAAYCISKILVDLPVQILCATVFIIPMWYLTSQPMEINRIAMAWILGVLITILAQTFGLVIGTACGVKLGLFVVPALNIPMLLFSEFFIPYHEMPTSLRFFSQISYFRYAFDAALRIVYDFNRKKLPCSSEFCMFKDPQKYLKHLGLSMNVAIDMGVIVGWIVILQICFIIVLFYKVRKACK